MTPKEHIVNIRRRLTGENSLINSDGKMVVDNLNQILSRAISELATNIYKKDSHFVMELIQNADDNNYKKGTIPTLKIIQNDDKIIFKNNEVGFNAENIDSICDISKSTKFSNNGIKGYIGEKGIGFKSVFRVSDEPEIYSNGYQFKFSNKSTLGAKGVVNKLAFILPEWIERKRVDVEDGYTNIILPFKKALSKEEKLRITDIEPDLILFLNKLQRLEIINEQVGLHTVVTKMRKGSIVTIQYMQKQQEAEASVIKKSYYIIERQIKVPSNVNVEQRKGVHNTKIILAFPIDNKKSLLFNLEQKVYSFLPIIESGFRFLIQSDFILTSGRESIDEDNIWNHFIRNEIVNTFKKAVDEFKVNPLYKKTFLNYIPYQRETFSNFFQPLSEDILDYCYNTKIVLSNNNSWCKPSEVISAKFEEIELFENNLLKSATQKQYLDINYLYNEDLFDTLDIPMFSDQEICICLNKTSLLEKKEIQWFFSLYSYLSKSDYPKRLANKLKKYKIIPIHRIGFKTNKLVSIDNGQVFYPLEQGIDYSFEKSISVISKELFKKIHQIKSRKDKEDFFNFLTELGIRYAVPYTITKAYILKKYETGEWKSCNSQELIDHLVYIKDHWSKLKDYQLEIINLLDNKCIIHCKGKDTDSNYFSTTKDVYISAEYGNKNSLENLFNGIPNISFINESYLKIKRKENKIPATKEQISKEWFSFFKSLGCKDIPGLGADSCEKEVLRLIETGNPEKINHLLIIFEKYWNEYKKYFNSINIGNKVWYKQLTNGKSIPIGKKLYYSKEVFIKNEKNKIFFGDSVTYFPRNILPDLAEKLGFSSTVDAESVIRYLSESSQKNIKLSKEKSIKLYRYLFNDDSADLSEFKNGELIYLPERHKWYSADQLFWMDYYPIFGNEYGYCTNSFPNYFREFCVDKLGILEKPQINHFILFLQKLKDLSNDEQTLNAYQKEIIYKIFSELGSTALKLDEDEESFKDLNEYIWTNKSEFWNNDDDIFYNDNEELFELFRNEEKIAFFDIPKNILPKTKHLLSILGVPAISQAVKTELLNEANALLDERLTKKVRKYSDAIISIIYSDYTSFYEESKHSAIFDCFKNIEVYESPEILLKYELNGVTKFFSADSFQLENRIYLSRDNFDKNSTLAFEISKLLNTPKLFEFVLLILTLRKNSITYILKQKNITPPPEEESVVGNPFIEFIDVNENQDYLSDDDDLDYPEESFDLSDEIDNEKPIVDFTPVFNKIISTERWAPEVDALEFEVNIEQYSEELEVYDYANSEGRVFSKNGFNTSNSINSQKGLLSQEDRDKIGDYGEKKVYYELIRVLKAKYPSFKFQHDIRNQIFQVSNNEDIIAVLKWLNSKFTIQEGYDLVLTENGICKYFEVKTTRGPESIVFNVSPQQWNFIKGKEDNYSIIRVLNAGHKNIRLIEINNPYRLWREGKLKAMPVSIEL